MFWKLFAEYVNIPNEIKAVAKFLDSTHVQISQILNNKICKIITWICITFFRWPVECFAIKHSMCLASQ